jgi:predicted Zn-dependent protease
MDRERTDIKKRVLNHTLRYENSNFEEVSISDQNICFTRLNDDYREMKYRYTQDHKEVMDTEANNVMDKIPRNNLTRIGSSVTGVFNTKYDKDLKLTLDEKKQLILYIEKVLLSALEKVFTITIEETAVHKETTNNYGLQAVVEYRHMEIMAYAASKEGSTYSYSQRLTEDFDKDVFCQKIINILALQSQVTTIPSGKYDILLDESISCVFVGKFLSFLKGYNLENSYFKDKINEQIMSPEISIIEDPSNSLPVEIDDDGVKCKKKFIIENGILKSYFLNKYYAKKFKIPPTGNCLNYECAYTSVFVYGGQHVLSDNYIYIFDMLSANFDFITGDFQISIQGVYKKDGKNHYFNNAIWSDNINIMHNMSTINIRPDSKDLSINTPPLRFSSANIISQ